MVIRDQSGFDEKRANSQPQTYVDRDRSRFNHQRNVRFHNKEERDRAWSLDAFHFISEKIDNTLMQGPIFDRVVDDLQHRELMEQKPKDLPYSVLHRFPSIDWHNARYRFDNIYYNGRCYLRIVLDAKETQHLLEERLNNLYGGLFSESSEPSLPETIRGIFSDVTKDQTTQILEAVALLKKKPAEVVAKEKEKEPKPSGDGMDHLRTANAARRAEDNAPGWHYNDQKKLFDQPEAFYTNVYFIGLLAEKFIVHNHPTLGLLIAL